MKFILLSLLIITPVYSQTQQDPFGSCAPDIKVQCPNAPSPKDKLSCLLKNESTLSEDCKRDLLRISEGLKDRGSRGGGGLSSFGGVMGSFGLMPPDKTILTVQGSLAQENRPTSMDQTRLNVASRIWGQSDRAVSLSAGAGRLSLGERQEWGGGRTPGELYRYEIGGQYSLFKEGSIRGMRASVGSASDRPFYNWDEVTFSLNGFWSKKSSEESHWIWTIFLSNNNPLLNYIPIPGFIYLYRQENFTGMFGLPFFSLQWTPARAWVLSTSVFLINVNAEIAYGFRDKTQGFVGFSSQQQSFLREEREKLRDRLFFAEKKLFLGFRSPVTRDISGEIQTGLSFDRTLKEGRSFNDTELEADLGRSSYVSLNLVFMI